MIFYYILFDFLMASQRPRSDRWGRATAAAVRSTQNHQFLDPKCLSDGALERQQKLLCLQEKLNAKLDYLSQQALSITGSGNSKFLTVDDCCMGISRFIAYKRFLDDKHRELEELKESFVFAAQKVIEEELYIFAKSRRHKVLSEIIEKARVRLCSITGKEMAEVVLEGSGAVADCIKQLDGIKKQLVGENVSKDTMKKANEDINFIIILMRNQKASIYPRLKEIAQLKCAIQNVHKKCLELREFFQSALVVKEMYDRSYITVIKAAKARQSEKESFHDLQRIEEAASYAKEVAPFSAMPEDLSFSPERKRGRGSSVVSFAYSESVIPSSAGDTPPMLSEEEVQEHLNASQHEENLV